MSPIRISYHRDICQYLAVRAAVEEDFHKIMILAIRNIEKHTKHISWTVT